MNRSLTCALVLIAHAFPSFAEDAETAPAPLVWQAGPATFPISGRLAEIELPDGYVFLDDSETQRFMELTENPVSGTEVATVTAAEDPRWFLVFEWDEMGYVPDEERDALDADALLRSIQEGNERGNALRRERGYGEFFITGWYDEPRYDAATNNLTWAIEGKDDQGHVTINRMTKLLGRRGVMTATLVAGPDQLAAAEAASSPLLAASFRFQPGSKYAEYMAGEDRLAKIGLGALVVGGGAAALAKSGLLARFWKLIVFGLVAVGAGARRLFFGGDRSQPPATHV
jgi:uncharacterized membrane-anchored protein